MSKRKSVRATWRFLGASGDEREALSLGDWTLAEIRASGSGFTGYITFHTGTRFGAGKHFANPSRTALRDILEIEALERLKGAGLHRFVQMPSGMKLEDPTTPDPTRPVSRRIDLN